MTRQIITEAVGGYGETRAAGLFDPERAEWWAEGTRWDGDNHVSLHTGSRWEHQRLYRTAGGRWVIRTWSQWEGVPETWEYVDADTAREWLIRAEEPEAVAEHFPGTPEETQYGRPEVGPQVVVRMPTELRDRIDRAARAAGMTRAEWIRTRLEAVL